MHGKQRTWLSQSSTCKSFHLKTLLQPIKPIVLALSKSLPPVLVWASFQEQTMDEDAPANVKAAQAAATKR
jgi:hypothetical protein